ncbi:Ulp1 protease family protein [Rutstroemia sp. NJR-2017a BVV2]|nr:Ulp1 protease family protein [Rutstroemia sp. NJR-2017a BVV2]
MLVHLSRTVGMAPEYLAAPASTPPSYQSKNRKTSHGDLGGPSSDSKVAAKGREELQFLIRELLSPQPESIDVDSVNRFDEAEPRNSGQGKGATQKRACHTDQDLEPYQQLHEKFLSNYDGKRDIQYNRYARASSEGPKGFRKVLILSDDDCASPGIMTSNLVDANNHCHDKDTTRNHISEVDEVSPNDFSSLRGLDDPFIAIERRDRRVNLGECTRSRTFLRKPDTDEGKAKLVWNGYRIPTIAWRLTAVLQGLGQPLPYEYYNFCIVKLVGVGAPQPRNTLGKKSAAPRTIINLHEGYPSFESSNKRRKLEHHSTFNGSSGSPIDLEEQDAGSDRQAVEQTSARTDPHTRSRAESDIHSGMSPATSRSFVQHIDNRGIALSTKSRNTRRKLQKQINNSSGNRLDQFPIPVPRSPGHLTSNHRLPRPPILHKHDEHDPTQMDELMLPTESFEVRIPHNVTVASKKTAYQAPTTNANGPQTSRHFSGSHASQISSKKLAGMMKRQPLGELELSGGEDELSQYNPSATEMQKPTTKPFGRKQEFNDVSSIETRGDITPTEFGNRGTGDHKKRQNDRAERVKSYKLVSIFSQTQYWVRPEDPEESVLRQDVSTGDLTLIRDQVAIEGFTISSKSINKLTRCQESEKIIIEKSIDTSIARGPKIYIELDTEEASSSLSNILGKAVGSTAIQLLNLEASQMDKTMANVRRKVQEHIDKQAARSTKPQKELPDDIRLLESNVERRGRSRKFENDGYADLQRESKKLKLRNAMKSDHKSDLLEDDDVQVQGTSAAITPGKFYGQEEVTGKTRASLRSADRPKISREPPKPRTPSPERWTRTHPGWDKNWLKSIIYPATGKKTATVDKQDIERLDEGEFLNDNLIMFYLYWLEQHHTNLANRVYVHNTFFYASLTNTAKGNRGINYEAVQRWTAKVDLPSYDYIIVPVNEHTHWYVAIICNASRLLESEAKSPTQSLEESATSIKEQTAIPSEQILISPSPKPSAVLNVDNDVGGGISQLSLQETGSTAGMDEQKNEENSPSDTFPRNHGLPAELPEGDSRHGIDISAVSPPDNLRPHSSAGELKTPVTKGRKKISHPPRVYDPKEPRIITFDSLGMAHSATCRNLRDYIVREINTRTGVSVTPPKSLGMTAKNIATQNNYCDCGVFLLGYMEEFFARPDAFIEDIMQSKYDNEAYNTNPSKLRAKIRDIVFDLQEEVRKAEEARKSKQAKIKAKKEPTKDKTIIESSNPPSKSTRTPPAVELSSNENAPTSSAQTLAPPSPAPQIPKNLPEVINLDDSQDQVRYEHNDSISTVIQRPASVPIEDPFLKQHVSSKATSPAPVVRRHRPTKSFGRLEIPDSQEEQAVENHGDDGHANKSLNSQATDVRFGTRASQYQDASSSSRGRSPPRDSWRSASQLKSPSPMSDDDDYAEKHTSNADDAGGLVIEAKSIPRKAASAHPVDLTEDEPDVMLLDRDFPDVSLLPNSSPVSSKSKQPRAHSESVVSYNKRKQAPPQRERIHDQASVDLTSPRKERSSKDIPNHQGYLITKKFESRDAAEDAMIKRQRHGH